MDTDARTADHLDPAVEPASEAGEPAGAAGEGAADPLRLLEVEDVPPGTFGELEPEHPPLIDGQGRVRLSFSRI